MKKDSFFEKNWFKLIMVLFIAYFLFVFMPKQSGANIFVNPIDFVMIVLTALTLIFTIFLCILGSAAFLGWQNLKDLRIRQDEILFDLKKTADVGRAEFKGKIKKMDDLIQKADENVPETKEELENYRKEAEKIKNDLEDSISRTKEKMSDLKWNTPTLGNSNLLSGFIGLTPSFSESLLKNPEVYECGEGIKDCPCGTSYREIYGTGCPKCGKIEDK